MRADEVVAATLLICSLGVPTGNSFCLSWSSCSTSASLATPRAIVWPTSRRPSPRRSRRSNRVSRNCTSGDAAREEAPQQQYTAEGLGRLSRSELQRLCKKLNLRAVGKTSELISRVLKSHDRAHDLHKEMTSGSKPPNRSSTSSLSSSSPSSSYSTDDATAAVFVKSPGGESPPIHLLAPVDGGSSISTETATAPAAAAVAAEAANPSTDFLLEDVRPAFGELSDEQWAKVGELGHLLTEWNGKINLISRKDIANVMRRHVVPCLAMAEALNFEDGIHVLDVGTGGGLPGLPLAICFPNVNFTLIDGTGKKILAVADMAERLGLANVRTFHIRAEDVHEVFDFVMGRAVTNLPKFVGFIEKNLKSNDVRMSDPADRISNSLKRGVLYMRGEVSDEELAELGARPSTIIPLQRVLKKAGQDGDVGLGGGLDDRGYSSVFHFTSEAIWNRVPITSGSGDRD